MTTWQNRDRARQLIDFSGIMHNGISPTDFDFYIDYKDKANVIGEFKLHGKPMNIGQTLALERAVKDCIRARKQGLAFVADHDVFDTNEDVIAKDAIVRMYLTTDVEGWHTTRVPTTVGELIERFLCKVDRNG